MGDGRAFCTVTGLLELTRFVAALKARELEECKENNAATVKQITPRSPWGLR